MRRLVVALLLVSTIVACRSDTVELAYTFPEGQVSTFLLTARAEAAWDIGEPSSGSYEVTFEVTETVVSSFEDGALLQVDMLPREVEETGLPSPGTEPRSFQLRVGDTGEVLEVIELNGIPADDLDPDQLVFIGTYRPPLPDGPVRLDDEWVAEQSFDLPATFQQIAMTGRLEGFQRDSSDRLARLGYSGEGPLAVTTELPQGTADLNGALAFSSEALFEIDDGVLREATSLTSGDFEVRVIPAEGELPISGTLHLQLELEVTQAERAA